LQLVSESDDDLGGLNAFFNEALLLIPQDEVLTLFFAKMEESKAFSSFLEKLNASDYENLTENLKVRWT
jgi:Insect allergen related repeat, nitrile-specifier detoxification